MATLKNLLYTGAGGYTKRPLIEFAIQNTTASSENGGCCCQWTVPAGTRYIKFEMWGGGGGGAGACCCMQGVPGGSGSYTSKTLCATQVVAGCQYTICAGGTSGASPTATGCAGYTSYVTGYNLSNFCARGGCSGFTACCNWAGNCQQIQMCYFQCCSVGGDVDFHGTCGGSRITMYCFNQGQQWAPVAPGTVSGPVFGPSGCTCGGIFSSSNCAPVFPGGGGFSAQAYGGACFCGWYGAAGLVLVTYA